MAARLKVGSYDDYGCPFVIFSGEKEKTVLSGNDVVLVSIECI